MHEAIESSDSDAVFEEFGDLLFAMVNLSRFLKINPEDALRRAVEKFTDRFQKVEARFKKDNKSLNDATLEEMDKVWNEVKRK